MNLSGGGRPAKGRPVRSRTALNPAEPEPLLRYEYDRGSNYEVDSRLTAALDALVPEDELINPDHRFFQIVHLVTEYAWVAMHHEIRRAVAALDADDFVLAGAVLDRAAAVGDTPVRMVRLLARHLPHVNLMTMRNAFPPNTTGLDSPGARNLRRAASAVWQSFSSALERHSLSLAEVAASPALEAVQDRPAWQVRGLWLVRDGLHRLDLAVQEWKQVHLRMVWSELGGHPDASSSVDGPGLGSAVSGPGGGCPVAAVDGPDQGGPHQGGPRSLRGRPISDLERMADRALFPPLWQAVDDTYQRMTGEAS